MNITRNKIGIAGILSVSALLGTVAIAAGPTPTLQQALQARISSDMRMPVMMNGQEPESGIARVAFVVGADGKTHDVTISKRSGSGMVDREAVRLISSFHGLPPGVEGRQVYAVLQYRTSGAEDDAAPRSALASQVALAHTDAVTATRIASVPPVANGALAAAALATVAYTGPALHQ